MGQTASDVRFVARRGGATLSLSDEGATLALRRGVEQPEQVSLKVANGRRVLPQAKTPLVTKINYLHGRDETTWHSDVPTFGTVTYPSVLDGVDLVYHGEDGQLEYDFVVAPGTNPSKIELDIASGGDAVSLTEKGDLAIHTSAGVLVQEKPRVYQRDADGHEQIVQASYRLAGRSRIAFEVASYDTSRDLVIDPVIGYATYLGGNGNDFANGITADDAGNAYVVGSGRDPLKVGPPVPSAPAKDSDLFVAKFGPTGTLLFITYVGGFGNEDGNAIAVDGLGRAFVTGSTSSNDFPGTDGRSVYGSEDAFIVRLKADGTGIEYASYVDAGAYDCGDCLSTRDVGYAIALSGNQVFIGGSAELDYQGFVGTVPEGGMVGQTAGAFVVALPADATGTVTASASNTVFFSYGASYYSAPSAVNALAIGSNGLLAVAGTACDDLLELYTDTAKTYQGTQNSSSCDAFVARLNVSLEPSSIDYATYFGSNRSTSSGEDGEDYDYHREAGLGVAVGTDGSLFLSGTALNNPFCDGPCVGTEFFPTKGPGPSPSTSFYSDAFVARFDPTKTGDSSLLYSRLLAGEYGESAWSVGVDSDNRAYVAGGTYSHDFVGLSRPGSGNDSMAAEGFVAELTADGSSILYASYVGGTDEDHLRSIAVRSNGVYLAGYTYSTDFVPTSNAAQPTNLGGYDAIVLKLSVAPLALSPATVSVARGGVVNFVASGGAGTGYSFNFVTNASGATLNASTGVYRAGNGGGTTDTVRVTDITGATATAAVTVLSPPDLVLSPSSASSSPRGSVQFTVSGGAAPYSFVLATNASGGVITGGGFYIAGVRGNVTDSVRVTDGTGQTRTASVLVGPEITITPGQASVAAKSTTPVQFNAAGGAGAPYTWTASGGSINVAGAFLAPSSTGLVVITARDRLGNSATANVSVGGALAVSPAAAITYPRGTVPFTPFGGTPPYTWTLVTTPPTGASVGATGAYTAPARGDQVDTLQLADAAGGRVLIQIQVGPELTLDPAVISLETAGTTTFNAAGGSGLGYQFSLSANGSGATLDAGGRYVAGSVAGTDEVLLIDSAGNEARAQVTVTVRTSAPPDNTSGGTSSGSPAAPADPTTPGSIAVGGSGGGGDDCSVAAPGTSTSSFSAVGLGLATILGAMRRRRRSTSPRR